MADLPVKWYTSEMEGAPVLMTAEDGSLVEMLHALLVTGFGAKEADGLTYDAETAEGVLLFSAGHTYVDKQVIEISGATPEEYNGQWRVSGANTTEVRFSMEEVPSSNGSGTITVKVPGAGWSRPFVSEDGYRAIFKGNNAKADGGSDCLFYVDNSDWMSASWGNSNSYNPQALIRGCEFASGIDDRAHEFGTDGYSLELGSSNDNSARQWRVVADDRTVYLNFHDHSARPSDMDRQSLMMAFGDITSTRGGESSDAFLIMSQFTSNSHPENYFGNFEASHYKRAAQGNDYLSRDCPLTFVARQLDMNETIFATDQSNPVVNIDTEVLARAYDKLLGRHVLLGKVPGLAYSLNGPVLNDNTIVEVEGKLFWVLRYESGTSTSFSHNPNYMSLFDIDGPWH